MSVALLSVRRGLSAPTLAVVAAAVVLSACSAGPPASGATPTNSRQSATSGYTPAATTVANAMVARPTLTDGPPGPPLHTDGQIVYTDNPRTGDPKQLYIEKADGTHLRQLVQSPDDDVQPTISPDGTHVVFTKQRDHGDLPDQIFMVGTDGKGLHQVLPQGCPPTQTCGDAVEGHAFSPDGKHLAFTRAVFPDPNAPPTYVELWTSDLDGSHAFRLTRESGAAQDDEASWSPDGKKIVFLHWVYGTPDRFRIATINIDGSGMRMVTPAGLDSGDPSYSPQGDRILFQSPPDPQSGTNQILYTVRPDGTALKPVNKHLTGVASFHGSWSADGRQILFCHIPLGREHGADLYFINRNGTDLHPLSLSAANENDAYWGPPESPGQ